MEPARESLPPGALLLPILPPTLDDAGKPVGEVQVVLAREPDGAVVAEAYTTPKHLATARGNLQPWVALEGPRLAELLDSQGVARLVVDAGSPDGYVLARDGTRSPLPAPLAPTTKEVDDGTP